MNFTNILSYDTEKLTEYFENDTLIKDIISTNDFRHLKHISFLGFLPNIFNSSKNFSRYEHSIGVAILADYISKKLEFKEEDRISLIIAALIHDIGHFPYSHVVEKLVLFLFNKSHHFLTTKIIKSNRPIARILKEHGLRERVLQLIMKKYESKNGKLSILFNNPINLDTLDAITRTAASVNKEFIDPFTILDGLKLKNNKIYIKSSVIPTVKDFWQLKNTIYKKYIYNETNLFHESLLFELLFHTYNNKIYRNIKRLRKRTDKQLWNFLARNPENEYFLKLISNNISPSSSYYFDGEITKRIQNYFKLDQIKRKISHFFNISIDKFVFYFDKIKEFDIRENETLDNHEELLLKDLRRILKRPPSKKIIYFFFINNDNMITPINLKSFLKNQNIFPRAQMTLDKYTAH